MQRWESGGSDQYSQQSLISRMEEKIKLYLKEPEKHPRPTGDQDPHFAYLITYLGELFVQGYRLIENYGNTLLLAIMRFQFSDTSSSKIDWNPHLPPRFKLVNWQISSKHIFQSGKVRRQLYSKMLEIGSFLEQCEYHIIYLRECRYSIVPSVWLQKNSLPHCEQYFRKIQWIQQKNGCRPIMQKQEGIQLHKLVESFIKGAGEGRNPALIKRIQGQNKFVYDLFKVINTVCYIIGKQILQNDYQTMSVQKWMRKATEKKFKRYDLLMRSEQKCSIVDWKFTRLDAEDKIKGASTQRKNQLYYQLARKDYKTDIELKFYCFHERAVHNSYHCFSCANFQYQIKTVDIDQQEKSSKLDQSQLEEMAISQIVIEDSMVDMIPDAPGEPIQEKNKITISLDSEEEVGGKKEATESVQCQSQSHRSIKTSNLNEPLKESSNEFQEFLVTNKKRIKEQKLKNKFPAEICEIIID